MSKKKDDCMEEQPGWYNGQFLDEVGFCCDFICRHPMVCVGGKFFSKEGRIHDENGIKKEIYEMLRPAPFPISRTRKSEKKLNEFLMIPRPA